MFKIRYFNSFVRAVVFGFIALNASFAAAETMTLSVPYRGALSMQTAATTIEFDASAIATGATISIQTVTTVTVPVPASTCTGTGCERADSTLQGDDILVRRISGTNRAQLTLTYFGSFGANFCAPTIASDRSFKIETTGLTFTSATNGYRISSFMSPSDASCDIAYVRVPSSRPYISGSTLQKLGRLPLNLVLVLDASPSMDWDIPASSPPEKRWNRLKSSVELFTSAWDVVGAPPPPLTVSSEGHAEDRLGLIFFGGTASESPLGGASFFKSRGTSASPWLTSVTSAVNAATYIGATSIGAGIAQGRTRLNDVDAVTGDTAIVLFTDGEQNTPPCIIRQGETTTPTTKPYPGLPGVTYVDQCTVDPLSAQPQSSLLTLNGSLLAKNVVPRGPIFTLGLGEGGMAGGAQLLDEISNETAGRARFPFDGATMETDFIDALVDHLKGGTVSLLERATGNVSAAPGASSPMSVAVDPSLTRLVFVLGWEGTGKEVELEIRQPNGAVVQASLSEKTSNSRVAAVDLPANGPSGAWQTRIILHSSPTHGGTTTPVKYHLSALGVESRLGSRVTESRRLGTGQQIKIIAEVGWDDKGLADLPPGAIRATIERPSENLGTVLHQSVIQDPQSAHDDASPLMMKIHQLARSAKLLEKIEPRPLPETVPLVSVGNGRYEGIFKETTVGGKYRIRVDYNWNDARTGKIRRTYIAERQVPVTPSKKDSLVSAQRDAKSGDAIILVTPKDRYGNFVGPGHEFAFAVDVEGLERKTAPPILNSAVDGNYEIRLTGIPAETDPRVKISFGGNTLRDATLSRIEGKTECGCLDFRCIFKGNK